MGNSCLVPEDSNRDANWKDASGTASLKVRLARLVPTPVFLWLRRQKSRLDLWKAYAFDFQHYSRFGSAIFRGDTQDKLAGLITIGYHGLEKGMSLHAPRPMFGRKNVRTTYNLVYRYVGAYGWDEVSGTALSVLEAYQAFNLAAGHDDPELEQKLASLRAQFGEAGKIAPAGGTKAVTRDEIWRQSKMDLAPFFAARSSIRDFPDEPVSRDLIRQAVKMAQKTPSVCNRQAGRVHLFDDRKAIARLLQIQGGARGFSESVPMLLVISADISRFQSTGERYQGWIDGGLFAMSVIYALHSLGLGSCCLNWSKIPQDDRALVRAVPELESERVIMFLAVGHLPEKLNVPISNSPPIEEVLSVGQVRES